MIEQILQKLKDTVDNPNFYRHLTPEEQAELFLILFAPKPKLFKKPKVIQGIDGKTPEKDIDYLGKESAEKIIADIASKTQRELEGLVKSKLDTLVGKDGKDAVITDDLIERIAELARSLIVIPDFPTLITMEPEAIRNALELLPDGEKLVQEAIEGLPERLEKLEARPIGMSGGLTRGGVEQIVNDAIDALPSATDTWTFYATTWSVEPTSVGTITGGEVFSYTLDGTTRYRFVPDTYDATEDAFYSSFSSPTLSGLLVARG